MTGAVWADEIAKSRKKVAHQNEWTDEVPASAEVEKSLRKKGATSRLGVAGQRRSLKSRKKKSHKRVSGK